MTQYRCTFPRVTEPSEVQEERTVQGTHEIFQASIWQTMSGRSQQQPARTKTRPQVHWGSKAVALTRTWRGRRNSHWWRSPWSQTKRAEARTTRTTTQTLTTTTEKVAQTHAFWWRGGGERGRRKRKKEEEGRENLLPLSLKRRRLIGQYETSWNFFN